MEANEIADVVLKPVAGTKGWGVLSLGSRAPQGLAWRTLPGGEEVDLAAIWRHCGRYFHNGGVRIEQRPRSHPILSAVLPAVLHQLPVVPHLRPVRVGGRAALRGGRRQGYGGDK